MIPSVIRTGMAIMLTGALPCPALAADIQTNVQGGDKVGHWSAGVMSVRAE